MSRTKKRLTIKTVVHRAREYVNEANKTEANKTEAIDSILRNSDYTLTEAQRLVEFIACFYDIESDYQIVSRWCDEHRMSRLLCRQQRPQEEDFTFLPLAPPPTPVRSSNCICGRAACENEWHRLAVWIRDNPQEWFRVVQEFEQRANKPDVA